MKRLGGFKIFAFISVIALLLAACSPVQDSYPDPTDAFYVNDYADVLDADAEEHIVRVAGELEDLTTAQVVVVTVAGIGDVPLEEYALGLFRKWGIGQEDKDNGVLIFIDVEGRQSRIEVGYGLEGALTDGKTGRIQDEYMIPYFRQGQYGRGIVAGFDAIVDEIYLEYGYTDRVIGRDKAIDPIFRDQPEQDDSFPASFIIWLLLVLAFIFIDFTFFKGAITFAILRSSSRHGGASRYNPGSKGGGFGSGRSGGGGSAGGGGSSRRW